MKFIDYAGNKIRRIRKHKKIKTSQLAESCNLSESGMRAIENGRIVIKNEHIVSISKALNVSTSAIRSRQIENYTDVMHILFEIEYAFLMKPWENAFVIKPSKSEQRISLVSDNIQLNQALNAWYEKQLQLHNQEISINDYFSWMENFPYSMESLPEES